MTFQSDNIFEDFPTLFCEELCEGFQIFHSWSEFLTLFIEHLRSDVKPLYVYKADLVDDMDVTRIFVDPTQLVIIPWDELDNYT